MLDITINYVNNVRLYSKIAAYLKSHDYPREKWLTKLQLNPDYDEDVFIER